MDRGLPFGRHDPSVTESSRCDGGETEKAVLVNAHHPLVSPCHGELKEYRIHVHARATEPFNKRLNSGIENLPRTLIHMKPLLLAGELE